jgi:putative membrane protein
MWNTYGHDGWFGMDGLGWTLGMGLHGIFGLAFVFILAAAFVLLVRHLWQLGAPVSAIWESGDCGAGEQALATLEQRYAHGDLDRDEFLQKRQDLV